MSRQANDQIPLGELLTRARVDKHLSRAQVAKDTGIAENSLIRYEKAGIDEDGQYPPSQKLAKLCFYLGISPLTSLMSCLSRDEFWDVSLETGVDWLSDHPQHRYLEDQYHAHKEDNQVLIYVLRELVGSPRDKARYDEKYVDWLKAKAREIIEINDFYRQQLFDAGLLDTLTQRGMHFPGFPEHPSREGKSAVTDYASLKRNGPGDHPNRSQNTTSEPEVVEATSSNQPKKSEG